ncbi:MAG: hypothetical protein LBK99_06610 [Opitutaceae bacterium]|jgi:hypothetical protein|nr:hypothetical protein [Opitutaceae bacterium]
MPTSEKSRIIVLNRLSTISNVDGLMGETPVKLRVPSSFAHDNAHGNLHSYKNLKEFESAARESGKRFRSAIDTGCQTTL